MAKVSGMLAASVGAAAKMMGSRNRNNRVSNQRPPKPQAAPAPVQQAPMDPMFVQNRFDRGATYIPGLYQPGMRGYDAQYGGGGWANFGKTPTADEIEGLKGKLASDFAAGRMVTSPTNPEPGQSPETQTTSQKSYKDIKSIGGGLKIGGDNILGRREAMKIARGTGRDFDKVLTKALGRGMSIGGGAVRQSNRAYEKSGQAGMDRAMGSLAGESPLSEMRRVTPGKRQMYSGTYQLDGQTMPLIESRRGGVASNLGGMGDGRRNRNKNNRRNKRGRGGAGDMEGTGMETSQTPQTPMTPMEPMTPEQMQEESSININMPGVGENVFSSATGFRSKRSSRKLAGRQAAGLASQRINPTGSWRYGV